MEYGLYIIRDTLTDGSEAFGVRLSLAPDHFVDIDCFGQANANSLVDALNDALELHGHDGSVRAAEIRKRAGCEV